MAQTTAANRRRTWRYVSSPDAELRERQIALAARDDDALPALLAEARAALTENPALARDMANFAAAVAEIRDAARDAAQTGLLAGQACRALGQHEAALTSLGAASDWATRAGDELFAAQIQIGAIDSLGVLGRMEDALALARRLESQFTALGSNGDAARALVNAGTLRYRRDEYTQAAELFERALPLFAPEDGLSRARVQANYAAVLTETGRYEQGMTLYAQARETFAAAGQDGLAARVDANLGWLHYVSGEYADALALLTRAFRVFTDGDRKPEAAKCDADRAEVYRELRLDAEALECYDRALPALQSFGMAYERGRALLGRAAALARTGRTAEADASLLEAEAIFQAQNNRLQTASVHLARAGLLQAEGNTAERLEAARQAERGFARRHAGYAAEARFLRVEAERELARQTETATEIALNEANESNLRVLRQIGRTARRTGRRWLACRVERALGLDALERGEIDQALRHFRAGIALLEAARALISAEDLHIAFLQGKFTLYEDCVGALLQRGKPRDIREALAVVERSRSRLLLERIQSAAFRAVDGSAGSPNPLRTLRAEISRAYQQMNALDDGTPRRFAGNGSVSPDAMTELETAYRNALREKDLREGGLQARQMGETSRAAPLAPPAIAEIQAALRADETLLAYFVSGDSVGAFLLTRGGLRAFQNIAKLPDVYAATRRLRYQLQRMAMQADYVRDHAAQMRDGMDKVLQELDGLLLRPLCGRLQEKLTIAPYGILHGLPFHAFHDGERYALDRFEIVYTPSAAIFHAGQKSAAEAVPAPGQSSLFALGRAEPNIARVTGEIAALAALFPDAKIFTGAAATRAAFAEFAPQSRLVHLATHALFRADNPLFSGLQCADGWIMARDLYAMRLNCELATLAACRTGAVSVVAGDELFGLIRGFLGAGASPSRQACGKRTTRRRRSLWACFTGGWRVPALRGRRRCERRN